MKPLKHFAPTVLIFIAVLALWEGLIRVLDIKQFLLPAPSVIAAAFVGTFGSLVASTLYTLRSALLGFAMGCGAGILVSFATARWTTVRQGLMPLAIAANSVPIVAFAPIMNQWFGSTNPMSKAMIVAVITFFPMMINMVRGLTLVEPAKLELMRSLASSPWEVLFKVRLPNALPYLFNGLKVCISLSLIGAVVGEFFGGPREALGIYIRSEASLFHFDNSWAAIIICSIAGIALYLIILLLERIAIPWHASAQRD